VAHERVHVGQRRQRHDGGDNAQRRFVALASHGIAASYCKPLKRNVCDNVQHEFAARKFKKCPVLLATPAGFEPATFSLEGCCSIP
jgi:hypothetical protein